MNRKLVSSFFLVMLMAMLMLSASVARADSLDITFQPASVNGYAGDTVSLYGIISAPSSNGAAVDLDSDSFTFAGPLSLAVDNFAATPVSLDPGTDSGLLLLFTVKIDPSAVAYNSYVNTYNILDSNGVVGTGTFQVNVVPEPASMLLLGSGLSGLVGVIRRKRQQ